MMPDQFSSDGLSLLLNNVGLQAGNGIEHFGLLFAGNFELVELCYRMFDRRVPVLFGNLQPLVRGLHIAPGVDAGAAGRLAEKINDQLADTFLRAFADANEKTAELFIGG